MRVSIHLHGLHRAAAGAGQIDLNLREGARVTEALAQVMAVCPNLPLADESFLVAVNDRVSHLEEVLQPEDDISLLPFLGGG